MATRNMQRGYGMTAEIADKINSQYSNGDETEIFNWFRALGLPVPQGQGKVVFQEHLADGTLLCNLANKIEPGSITKIHDIANIKILGFKSMKSQENIAFFLNWAKSYGVNEAQLFQTPALFESTNLPSVQKALFALGGQCQKKGFQGPVVGVKIAKENKREFTDEQLKAGMAIPSKQMGDNKGASQAGMIGYGTGRQILDPVSEKRKGQTDVGITGLQMGTNQGASQSGMTCYGAGRQIIDQTSEQRKNETDTTHSSLQMGSNQGSSQSGMTAPGSRRQIIN